LLFQETALNDSARSLPEQSTQDKCGILGGFMEARMVWERRKYAPSVIGEHSARQPNRRLEGMATRTVNKDLRSGALGTMSTNHADLQLSISQKRIRNKSTRWIQKFRRREGRNGR
jgi:hypothetical protein